MGDYMNELIGNTPLVEIFYRFRGQERSFFAKLEYYNFTGSIKDRVVWYILKKAKEEGMFAIMRFFVIDSIAYESIRKQTESVRPDMIEILPGLMPKVIRHICRDSIVPVIAGGLITDREDIMGALGAGAISISTTNQKVWFM